MKRQEIYTEHGLKILWRIFMICICAIWFEYCAILIGESHSIASVRAIKLLIPFLTKFTFFLSFVRLARPCMFPWISTKKHSKQNIPKKICCYKIERRAYALQKDVFSTREKKTNADGKVHHTNKSMHLSHWNLFGEEMRSD